MSAFWMDRSVFLTGGTGFIGTEIARALTQQGAQVTCLTRDAGRAEHLELLGCSVVEGDVTEPDTLVLPEDVDTVVHGAAWVAFGVPRRKRETFVETNVGGTRNVLAAAKEAGAKRFCHLSSVAAIGATPAGLYGEDRVTEGRLPLFHSLYERTKYESHVHVLENAGTLRTTLPMPGMVLGTDSDTEFLLRGYAEGTLWNVRGDNPTGWVHVRDVVDGVLRAIEHGKGPYLLVDQNLLFDELMALFEEASGIEPPGRALPIGALKLLAQLAQLPYHLRGKVPPLSRELVEALALPMTYSSLRAHEELSWKPSLLEHLRADFERIRG